MGGGFKKVNRLAAAMTVAVFASPAMPQAVDPITLGYERVWLGSEYSSAITPYRITLENVGRNDRGEVVLRAGSYQMRYPIELPANTEKEFITYVVESANGYEPATISLATRQARMSIQVNPSFSYGDNLVFGMISDTPGLMSFLKPRNEGGPTGDRFQNQTIDVYCKPGKAPDRSVGYSLLDVLVLGEGSERLTDGEVAAIQRFVLGGGNLLFIGGASAPILNDRRWAGFLPIKDARPVTVPRLAFVDRFGPVAAPDGISITTGTAVLGAKVVRQGKDPIQVHQSVGLGSVTYWAFNPFEQPLSRWEGRKQLLATLPRSQRGLTRGLLVSEGAMASDPYSSGYYDEEYGQATGPFTARPPSIGTIFLILASYIVVVVPINFLILGALKRREWAWVTAPLISLGFAGIFFSVSSSLYSAELSRATTGVLIGSEGTTQGTFLGHQQMFFPSGGRYDLGLKEVELLYTQPSFDFSFGGRTADTGFGADLYDVGTIAGPEVAVTNLSFKEFLVRQAVPIPSVIRSNLRIVTVNGLSRMRGTIINQTNMNLAGVQVSTSAGHCVIGLIAPGATTKVDAVVQDPFDWDKSLTRPRLVADISAAPFASQLGRAVPAGQPVRLYYTLAGLQEGSNP